MSRIMLALLMGVGVATHVYVKVNSPNPQWLIYMTNQVETISKVLSKHYQGIALLAIHYILYAWLVLLAKCRYWLASFFPL